jgi:hypothetical protein
MATGVVFGQPRSLLLQPGAYSLVDASALNLPQGFAYNVVAVLGAGLGGAPMVPYYLKDPIQAQQLFGATTPLAEAIRFAFQGGANGGASVVIGVRVDNTAQATGSLIPAVGASLDATFADYGAYGNSYSLSFYPGSSLGVMAVIRGKFLDGRDFYQKIDNETSFSNLIDRINRETPLNVDITGGGARATQTINLATSQADGRATLSDAQRVTQSNQVYFYQYPAGLLPNISDSVVASWNGTFDWTIASVDATANTLTTSASTNLVDGHLVKLAGVLPAEVDTTKTYVVREVASGTTFTIAPLLSVFQSFAIGALDISSNVFTAAGNTFSDGDAVRISGTLPTGLNVDQVYFVRDKSSDNFKLAATVGGTAIDVSGSFSGLSATKIAGGALDITAATPDATSKVSQQFGVCRITNSVPSGFNGTRTPVKIRAAYTQAVSNLIVSAAAYTSDSARFTMPAGTTWGNISGKGLPGSIFTIASSVYAGTYQILHYEWDGLAADRVRIVRKISGDRLIATGTLSTSLVFYPSLQFAKAQPATEAEETQLPGYGVLSRGGQYLTVVVGDKTVYYSTQPGDTIELLGVTIANMINQTADMPVIAATAYNAGTYTATVTLTAKIPGTAAIANRVNVLVNTQNLLLATANGQTLVGGVDPAPPQDTNGNITGTLLFAGGYDSAPTYQRWLDGLEAIKYLSCRWVVPATDNAGVQVAVADHCELMSTTPNRRERMAVMGHGLGWTQKMVRDRAELFQSERVVFASPGFTSTDSLTGLAKTYSAVYTAAIVAGMLASEGNGISDPITHTYLRNASRLELEYKPGSQELDDAIESGVLAIERDPALTRASRGFRVTRAITTYRVSVNAGYKSSVYESISVVNQSDYIAARIREMEESLFVGRAIFAETLESIRIAVNLELQRQVRDRTIYGYDSKFTTVSLNADSRNAVDVAYKIYPAPALEFVLNTQLLFPIPESEAIAGGQR